MKQNLEGLSHAEKLELLDMLRKDVGGMSRYDTDEFMELSLEWAKDRIPSADVCRAIGHKNYSASVAIGLRRAIRFGRLIDVDETEVVTIPVEVKRKTRK